MNACACPSAARLDTFMWHYDVVTCVRCDVGTRLAVWTPDGHVCWRCR